MSPAGYWPSPWPGEDADPARTQCNRSIPGPGFDASNCDVVFREAIPTTMVVLRSPGEVYALRHTMGPDTVSWVERIDPETLEPVARSVDLPGGPTWPGGIAAHENGSLYVVYGNHTHRLDPDLTLVASRELPRHRPYNSFVILADGHLATKDFGGVLPGTDPGAQQADSTELLVLDPQTLHTVASARFAEASIARISTLDDTVYVVGVEHLMRAHWTGQELVVDDGFDGAYVRMDGQSYGWDPVITQGAAWFLDNGFGSERYAGTFHGQGLNSAPLHLVRVDLDTGVATLAAICGEPNGVIANPPLIDPVRSIAVGYDSGNGVLAAFDIAPDGSMTKRWRRDQNHAAHMLLFHDTGELLTTDHDASRMADQLVVLDIESGAERLRIDSGSAVQSVLFPAVGWDRDVYYCSFNGIARLSLRK